MAEHHKHGSMDIEPHVAAFNGFIKGAVIVAVISVVVLIFLAIVGT